MESTKNYAMFKFLPSNREIIESKVGELIASIKQKNLLEFRPILVDENHGVIDGQHRLKAAEALQIPIYFHKKKGLGVTDMIMLNTAQSNWGPLDYLNAFCAEGNKNYILFRKFLNEYSLNLRVLFVLFDLNAKGRKKATNDYGRFLNGQFKYPDDDSALRERLENLIEVCNIIQQKTLERFNFVKSVAFALAFCKLFNIESVDYDIFKKKLMQRLDMVRLCRTQLDYLKMLAGIYNYRNPNPIQLGNLESLVMGENI